MHNFRPVYITAVDKLILFYKTAYNTNLNKHGRKGRSSSNICTSLLVLILIFGQHDRTTIFWDRNMGLRSFEPKEIDGPCVHLITKSYTPLTI